MPRISKRAQRLAELKKRPSLKLSELEEVLTLVTAELWSQDMKKLRAQRAEAKKTASKMAREARETSEPTLTPSKN